jgi:hypothetical protein
LGDTEIATPVSCYVYFIDKDTERFVRSRIEGVRPAPSADQREPVRRVAEDMERYRAEEERRHDGS